MTHQSVRVSFNQPAAAYEVRIGSGLISTTGKAARSCFGRDAARVSIVSNPTVFKLYGEQVLTSLRNANFDVSVFLMKDGERFKSLKTMEAALQSFAENGLTRTDGVVALGGGVVGDLAGFAAAVYLRGLPFVQVPTTLLAMIDSSVGGKTGVNSNFGKNRIGAFHQPSAVLIDTRVLNTLPEREMTAGLCEMIKHGAIGGRKLLNQTSSALEHDLRTDPSHFHDQLPNLIAANVTFKASIVTGDERESSRRMDGRSRKILNFGHTLAHALEKVTDYRYFRHGEAVGYGIIFAAEVSKELALLDEKDVKSLNDVVHRAGKLPPLDNISAEEVIEAFRFDKKHLSGSLQMVLLKSIGKPVIVSERDIPRSAIRRALKKLL